jgi:nitronate monooxygenase
MAGGPSTPGLVIAAAGAGALGFLAAGYKTAAAVRAEMDAVRAGAGAPFGVNVFVPGNPAADRAALARYLAELEPDAAALDVRLGAADWDDDDWDAKLAALLAGPPAVVSFTFGCPDKDVIAALRAAGSQVWVTVTAPQEAAVGRARCGRAVCPGPRGRRPPRHVLGFRQPAGRAAAPTAP